MEKEKSLKINRSRTLKLHQEFYINDNEKNEECYKFKDNSIDTTKYNIITFLPKALLYQFMRLANCYFLIVAIIQCISLISPLSPTTAIAPIAFVLCVSIIREGIEDYARHKYDKMLNNEIVYAYRDGVFVETVSGSLRIGELVYVQENDPLPADLILIDSNHEEGISYIETATLDGEKTLKTKIPHKNIAGFFNNGGECKRIGLDVSGKCTCDTPNSELYKIEGNLDIYMHDQYSDTSIKTTIPIEAKQLVLKGAILKNTLWIIGFVIYTGKNTKLILNSKKPRMKFSKVENLMSKLLVVILILQILFCMISALLHYIYNSSYNNPFLPRPINNNMIFDSFISYFTYMLLLNTMIPISLIISLEIVKLIQGYFTRVDVELYSNVRERFSKAGSISLNEELGQVDYIFSDKTGTLTCNKMIFKYCVIGDVCYEYKKNDKTSAVYATSNFKNIADDEIKNSEEIKLRIFGPRYMQEYVFGGYNTTANNTTIAFNLNRTRYDNYYIKSETNADCYLRMEDDHVLINEFWKALSLAHECICNQTEEGYYEYSGLSPDDIELVKTAAEQGYEFLKSSVSDFRRVRIGDTIKEFKVLHVLEFSSDRKRMSIIVREEGQIKLFIKGADSEIKTRLSKLSRSAFLEQASNYVESFSAKGLRTLLVAMKVIDDFYYDDWCKKLHEAELDLLNKEDSIKKCYEEIEKNVYLLGATVVEDKLQDEVPQTIRDLRLAGIKIWMLTGDKMNTAFNIGLSCNLISKSIKNFYVCGEKGESLDKLVREFSKFCEDFNNANNGNGDYSEEKSFRSLETKQPFSVIIDAVSLANILSSTDQIDLFLRITSQACSVICCRVSPLQKSEVVAIMKKYQPFVVTLSIGDGGNDVSMIMEAHIGIGVYGEEGMRAVQASDFAIGEFKLLRRLLLFHGRVNIIRISEMILYFFFKNFIITIIHFYYGFYNKFSGQTIFDDWFISLYNMIFTAAPLAARALSDFDIIPDDGLIVDKMLPFLYKENRDNPIFTKSNFILSLIRGIVFGIITFYMIICSHDNSSVDMQGNLPDIWYLSANIFTAIILVVSFRILIVQKHFIWPAPVIMIVTSWLSYFCFVVIVNFDDNYKSYATMGTVFGSCRFYLSVLSPVVTCYILDKIIYSFGILFSKTLSGTLMIQRAIYGRLDNINIMPDLIKEKFKQYAIYECINVDIMSNLPNIKDFNKIERIDEDNSQFKNGSKSGGDASNKLSQELMLMEAPYSKGVSKVIEKKMSELIDQKNKDENDINSIEKNKSFSNQHLLSNEREVSVIKNLNSTNADPHNLPMYKKINTNLHNRVKLIIKDDDIAYRNDDIEIIKSKK